MSDLETKTIGFWIWMILSPVYILVGSVGNITSLIVLCRRKMIKNVSSLFLISLAISDLLTLYSGVLIRMVSNLINHDVEAFTKFGCQINIVCSFVFRDISSWLIVSLTSERVIATFSPYKYKRLFTRRNVGFTVLTIVVCSLAINSFLVSLYHRGKVVYGNATEIRACLPTLQENVMLMRRVWPLIHVCKSNLIPSGIMFVATVAMIRQIYLSHRNQRVQVAPSINPARSTFSESTNNAANELSNAAPNFITGAQNNAVGAADNVKLPPLSKLLLCMNVLFIATNSPIFIYYIVNPRQGREFIPLFKLFDEPITACLYFLSNSNLVINFLLYCCTGQRFRSELKMLLSKCRAATSRSDNSD